MLGFTLLYLHLSPEFRQDVNQVRQLRLSQETKFQLTISSTPLIAAILIGVFFAEKNVHVIVIELVHKDNCKPNQNIFPLKSLNAVLEIYLEERSVEGVRAWVAE